MNIFMEYATHTLFVLAMIIGSIVALYYFMVKKKAPK
ncbi:EYxxD motif small membrane protein [Pseudalkalibacillus decolorationis]